MDAPKPTVKNDALHEIVVGVVLFVLDGSALDIVVDDRMLLWAFLQRTETLDEAARRALVNAIGIDLPMRQLRVWKPEKHQDRVPLLSVSYVSCVDAARCEPLGADVENCPFAEWKAASDHDREVAEQALAALRADLPAGTMVYGLLPDTFTLRALQRAHEAISGRTYHRMAFRKRLLDSGRLEATGQREEGGSGRPAELYRLNRETGA